MLSILFSSEFFKYFFVLFWLFMSFSFIVTRNLWCKLFIKSFKPFVSFNFRFKRRGNLNNNIFTSFLSIFYGSKLFIQGWDKISSTSPWAPKRCFGFLFKILNKKSWASGLIFTFSENLTYPSLMSLNINDWDLL